jgi:hypothetical protein
MLLKSEGGGPTYHVVLAPTCFTYPISNANRVAAAIIASIAKDAIFLLVCRIFIPFSPFFVFSGKARAETTKMAIYDAF